MQPSTPRTLPPDYHTHNRRCQHARGTVADYVRQAEAAGVAEIACTDHLPVDDRFGVETRMPVADFPDYVEEVRAAAASAAIPVRLGIEADYYRGCEPHLARVLDQYPFDVVLGSVHFRDYFSTDPAARGVADRDRPDEAWTDYFRMIGELAGTGLVDIIGHLDLPKRFGMPTGPDRIGDAARRALDAIANAGMAIEINTSGAIHAVKEFYPSLTLLTWARERDIPITFGSDAHDPERVGDGFAAAVATARDAGYTASAWFDRRERNVLPFG